MAAQQFVPYDAHAKLHVYLEPTRDGSLVEIVGEEISDLTGARTRVFTCRTGKGQEQMEFTGATYTGVGTADLLQEKVRLERLRQALDEAEAALTAALKLRGKG